MNKRRVTLSILLGLAIFLALTGTAWAANCGDTAGPGGTNVPCSCGDTVITNTTLISPAVDPVKGDPVVSTNDTDVCTGDGLIMNTAKVNLSLGGNAIRGSGVGVGVRIVGVNIKVTIRSGIIRGFDTGLASDTGSSIKNSLISNVTATENLGSGIILEGSDNELNTNAALANGDTAIQVEGNDNDLLFNRVSHNANNGIQVSGDGNTLYANNLNKNAGTGIRVEGNDNIVAKNSVENSGIDGIVVAGDGDGDPTTLELWKNKVLKNNGYGIIVDGNAHDIVANQGDFNGRDGIAVVGTGNLLGLNKARENQGNGLIATGVNPTDDNIDDGGNLGKKNSGAVQCKIDGLACSS
jgi:copper-binding protein NosD